MYSSIFPQDTITFNVDNPSAGATLLTSVPFPRTILYAHLSCREQNPDVHIRIGSSGSDYVIDSERTPLIDIFTTETLASGTPLTYDESASAHCQVQVNYINRLLASTSPETYLCSNCIGGVIATTTTSTSSSLTMINSNNIEKISYIATTTQISGSQTQTVASYYIPFTLFAYFSFLVIAIFGVIIYAKRK